MFLLSDGEPNVGVTNTDQILDDVKEWNRKRGRRADIHCISMAGDMDLLVRLGGVTKKSSFMQVE